MDIAYWESVADRYDAEIFSVLACDREGAVLACIDTVASPEHTAADLGCGVGKWLPHLAARFQRVLAVDVSEKCLEHAKVAAGECDTVAYMTADLAAPGRRFGKFDFVLCVNVAITPDAEIRWALLSNVARCVRSGGHALFVVPSVESALYAKHRLVEQRIRAGEEEERAWLRAADKRFRSVLELQRGVVEIEKVRTKHYLREELITTLGALHLTVQRVGKVEYPWETEFIDPPRWLRQPYPWDWMALATKK
jgi:SAM-dependent methyltransferase